jgi:hypothetical protein
MTNEKLELCNQIQTICDYEIACGNIIQRVDKKRWPKIDLLISFKYPLYATQSSCNIYIDNSLLQRMIKSSESPLEISFISFENRQAIAGPADRDILCTELCSELREIYDFEIKHGNKIDRIDRLAWDKIDLLVVFAFPLNIDKQNHNIYNESLIRYVNQDLHYPLETSYTAKDCRQAIAGPNY